MAKETLELHILTPNGPKRQGLAVAGVEVPGLLGEIGVLPQHEPYITAIKPGVVRFREGNDSKRIAVGSGFLEVTVDGRVILMVDRAAEGSDIDRAAVDVELRDVGGRLASYHGAVGAAEYRSLSDQRAWLEAQIRATGGTI